jgi:glycosyltransferase involved in cell wall biosynthesis
MTHPCRTARFHQGFDGNDGLCGQFHVLGARVRFSYPLTVRARRAGLSSHPTGAARGPQLFTDELVEGLRRGMQVPEANEAAPERKLRVVVLSSLFSVVGGAEHVATELVIRLDGSRFERTACSTRTRLVPSVDDELIAAGVRLLRIDRRSRRELLAWWPLISLLRRERIDILHAHGSSNVLGTVLARLARVPVVITHVHTGRFDDGPIGVTQRLRRRVETLVLSRWADAVLAVSDGVRRRLIEHEGVDPNVIRIFPNGVPALPDSADDRVRRELGIPPDAPVVGTVCVLRQEKGLDVLVESSAILSKLFPRLKVLIAGIGPEEARLRAMVAEAGLEDTVLFLGARRDVPHVLASLDVALCTSDWEGMPISVLEYMAAGKAVVSTRVGGIPDLLENGLEGLLVDRRDSEAVAEAVARLLRDDVLRKQLGARARERQRRDFELDGVVRRLEHFYETLFATTHRARRERLGGRQRL